MNVSYLPLLDLEFGCRTQKQITDLNSRELSNAIEIVFKQISSYYKQVAKNDKDYDTDTSGEDSPKPKKKQEISLRLSSVWKPIVKSCMRESIEESTS